MAINQDGFDPSQRQELRQFKAEVFRVLAHPTRIHIVEALGEGELCVGDIAKRVGGESANLSQHLAVLRSRRLVVTRKEGNMVIYSLRDKLLTEVLGSMKEYFVKYLAEWLGMLESIREEL